MLENTNYYNFYQLLAISLKEDNIPLGIEKALDVSKNIFSADDVIVYKLDDCDNYIHVLNQPKMDSNSYITTSIINKAKKLLENKDFYPFNLDFENLKGILFLPISLKNEKYGIAITYKNQLPIYSLEFINLYIETMKIIFSKLEQIKTLSKSAETDSLTGLNNRVAYDKRIKEIITTDNLVYGLFDLFRLKRINDNYSHDCGDEYIRRTAQILKKYFPKYSYSIDNHGKNNKISTGSCLYRIGGDEFVLLSSSETYEDILIKIMILRDEIKNLDLKINEFIGINYGLVERNSDETIKDLYLRADGLLSKDKAETYKILGIDRRK